MKEHVIKITVDGKAEDGALIIAEILTRYLVDNTAIGLVSEIDSFNFLQVSTGKLLDQVSAQAGKAYIQVKLKLEEKHPIPEHSFVFPARVEKVIDGDTFNLTIDQGMHSFRVERVRLLGYDTPEKRKPTREAGIAAQRFVESWFDKAEQDAPDQRWPLIIKTEKDPDNFGRYLTTLWRVSDEECLGPILFNSDHAFVYKA